MNLKLVVLDVDGCLCDGKIYDSEHKVIGKVFNDLDMTAIKCFKALEIKVVLLTSDTFNLGLAEKRHLNFYNGKVFGQINKLEVFDKILKEYNVDVTESSYLGDDKFDIPVLSKVPWSFCPSNSFQSVKNETTVVLKGRSGQNLVCEMFDWFVDKGIIQEPDLEDLVRIDGEEK